jgi:hypothetical protein
MNLKSKISWFFGIYIASVCGFILVNALIEWLVHHLIGKVN